MVCVCKDTATAEYYTYRPTLAQHDALPVCCRVCAMLARLMPRCAARARSTTTISRGASASTLVPISTMPSVAAKRSRKALEIGRAPVGTPVTNANLVCHPLLETKNNPSHHTRSHPHYQHPPHHRYQP